MDDDAIRRSDARKVARKNYVHGMATIDAALEALPAMGPVEPLPIAAPALRVAAEMSTTLVAQLRKVGSDAWKANASCDEIAVEGGRHVFEKLRAEQAAVDDEILNVINAHDPGLAHENKQPTTFAVRRIRSERDQWYERAKGAESKAREAWANAAEWKWRKEETDAECETLCTAIEEATAGLIRDPMATRAELVGALREAWLTADRERGFEREARQRVEAERDRLIERVAKVAEFEHPIPLRIHCPDCGELHVDEGEQATTPHRTHACQFCGHLWAPAVVATVGVRFLPGCKNEPESKR